jgi:hypothetical protein
MNNSTLWGNMKTNKNISVALSNAIVLFMAGSLLAGCQKRSFQKIGALTKLSESKGRFIASAKSSIPVFTKFQDPKQIIVYCENTSKRVKICYKDQLTEVLNEFKSEHRSLSLDQQEEISSATDYSNIRPVFDNIVNQVKRDTKNKVDSLVKSRKNFCKENSKHDLTKCLTQYIEKDTFTILNSFHGNKKLNGHEYIYFKKQFKALLNQNLMQAKDSIEQDRNFTL